MKKRILLWSALSLLVVSLLSLGACSAEPTLQPYSTYSITEELTQQYELTDLRWQEGLFRAIAHPDNSWSATAGLQAGTGRLIVAYSDRLGWEFWLECHRLNAAEQALVLDQDIPTECWMTNDATPEHQAELLLQDEDGQYYAIYLRSESMTEEKMLECARTVHVWLPGAEDHIDISCTDAKARVLSSRSPWTQSGDAWPDAEDDRLSFRVNTTRSDIVSSGHWRLQRLDAGRWYDMDQEGDGLQCSNWAVWGSLELSLPAGSYRLLLDARSQRGNFSEVPYYFQSAG